MVFPHNTSWCIMQWKFSILPSSFSLSRPTTTEELYLSPEKQDFSAGAHIYWLSISSNRYFPVVVPFIGKSSKISYVISKLELHSRINTASRATSFASLFSSTAIETAWKSLQISPNWLRISFASSLNLSAIVFRPRLMFLKSFNFLWQIIFAVSIKHS